MELVIASRNVHKIRELRAILRAIDHLDITSLLHWPEYTPPEESADTFEGNAKIKAEHAARALNKHVLADDSGLVVPILDGRPGVHSRRYAGDDATDAENRQKLLAELKGRQELDRSAYYECHLILAAPDGIKKSVRGICEGYILDSERGRNGFGYDSLFVRHDTDTTFAQLSEETKNRISHRRKAVEKLLAYLEQDF